MIAPKGHCVTQAPQAVHLLSRIKALSEDEIVYCEDTGRILVRGNDAF